MLKKFLRVKLCFFILICALFFTTVNILGLYLFLPGPLQSQTVIIIKPNSTILEISDKLNKHHVIKYPQVFYLLAKLYAINCSLKSGEYMFTANISPLQVLMILSTGKSIIHKLIVLPGSMVYEVIQKVNGEKRLFGEIETVIPEGFLMPDTYYYSYGDYKEHLISQMRAKMSLALDEVMLQLSSNSPLKTRLDVLILASIIEKEAGSDAEKPIIAAVFLNRLKKGMKLQADPTTIYAITEGKFKFSAKLTRKDLKLVSNYNTYHISGLPVGAIACPSIKSLKSVVRPAKTNALYFVVNGQGGHNFSDTLVEHNKHIENYKKMLSGSDSKE